MSGLTKPKAGFQEFLYLVWFSLGFLWDFTGLSRLFHRCRAHLGQMLNSNAEVVTMRVLCVPVALMLMVTGAACVYADPGSPAISAGQLVNQVVYNELNDHATHGYWRFWLQRHAQNGTVLEDQIETADGPVGRILQQNGQPAGPQLEGAEADRLQRLLTSPQEQEHLRRQHDEDERRIGRILELLPNAFVYTYDGEENGCYRLRFKPNPDYSTSSIEGRIFHSMSGTLWVDARYKRLARLEGRVGEDVDFGFGILGRLYKGGWFLLERTQVSPTDWKTDRLEVHMNVRAFMVKSFARETSETRGGFERVPSGMKLAQGVSMLEKQAGSESAVSSAHAPLPPGAMGFRP
jgi:hypothetical protein